jgi:hypothetical protein
LAGCMTKAEEYLKRANDCLALAADVSEVAERRELERMARMYMRLAEHALSPDEANTS